jgi:hypothetical protein
MVEHKTGAPSKDPNGTFRSRLLLVLIVREDFCGQIQQSLGNGNRKDFWFVAFAIAMRKATLNVR